MVSSSTKPSAREMSPCVQVSPMACTTPAESRTTAMVTSSMTTRTAAPTSMSASAQILTGIRSDRRAVQQFRLDGVLQPGLEFREADLLNDLREEAANDETACLVLRDAASLKVEELLVIEASRRARMARAEDVAGLDLEVRNRVGARALGEQQVTVLLVAVGAGGGGTDQDVADPHCPCAVALERALVAHPGLRIRSIVVNKHLLLEVLAAVCKVHAIEFGVSALAAKVHGGVDAQHLAAERDEHVLEMAVALHFGEVAREVYCIRVPFLHRDDGEVRALLHQNLDVLTELRRTAVVDDDKTVAVSLGRDHEVGGTGGRAEGAASDRDPRWLLALDGHRECPVEITPRACGCTFFRRADGADARVVTVDPVDRHRARRGEVEVVLAACGRLREERAEQRHRGVLPLGFESGHRFEVRDVEGAEPRGAGLYGNQAPAAIGVLFGTEAGVIDLG